MLLSYIFLHSAMIVWLIMLGVMFRCGKGPLVKTALMKAEKNLYNTQKLGRFVGNLMFMFSACLLVSLMGYILNSSLLTVIGIWMLIFMVLGALVYVETSSRFRKS